ncbi:IS630 family transposase [Deinococcus planocerae]|uniref:IS630 family transposase n=1 Tax=Deinococcus planocerae TaxID=1737569 RepID=UPI000C7EC74A|nr:IS630 family transposase [Deinococcus planocerae]
MAAAERDEAWRAQFVADLAHVVPSDLLYLDESGFQTNMTRTHARCPRGQRAIDIVPRNRGKNLTLLCALTLAGSTAPLVVEGGVNGSVVITYVREVLVPVLRPGQVVVLDNLGAHLRPKVRELVEATGALLVYLPPYSPDLNPIEFMFSKLKAALRALAARTREGVLDALRHALDAVTLSDAQGWFQQVLNLQLFR